LNIISDYLEAVTMTGFKRTSLIFALLVILHAGASGQEIVRAFPAPGPLSRGLTWDGEHVWAVDAEVDSIFKVDPQNGAVVHSIYFETFDPFGGLTLSEDGNLWLSNGPTIYLLDSGTGDMITNFGCPGG
jgi:outer membrane protein assembly factor BamB